MEPFAGLRISTPLVASASVGLQLGDAGETVYRPTFEAEAGIGGGRLLLGLDSLGDGLGFGLQAAFLRTWGKPAGLDTDQSYLGPIFQIGYRQFFGDLGLYRRVEGDDDDWLASLGFGFRL
jgi:hypothetical protein